MNDAIITISLADAERMKDTLIFSSGVLLGVSKEPDDVYARQSRALAWHGTALAVAMGAKSFLHWRYD